MGKMKNIPVFAIDFEGSSKIGIVEYGVAELADGEIVSAHTRICAPKRKIPRRDAEFFGISNDVAEKRAPFSDDLPLFCRMRSRGIFMAHNAPVEDSLLRAALPSPGMVRTSRAAGALPNGRRGSTPAPSRAPSFRKSAGQSSPTASAPSGCKKGSAKPPKNSARLSGANGTARSTTPWRARCCLRAFWNSTEWKTPA